MRGKKIGEREREIVTAGRESGLSYKKAAEAAGISEASARRIILEGASERTEKEKEAAESGKETFIKDAWEVISGSVELIKKRLAMAQADAGELMEIINDVIEGKELDDKRKNKLAWLLEKQAREMTVPSLRELAGVVGTMYDRQALLSGEATENIQLTQEDMKLIRAISAAEKMNEKCD